MNNEEVIKELRKVSKELARVSSLANGYIDAQDDFDAFSGLAILKVNTDSIGDRINTLIEKLDD